jgi:hypothetical protein
VLAVVTENPKFLFKAPNNAGRPDVNGDFTRKTSSFISNTLTTHAHTNKDLFVAGYDVKIYSAMQFRSLSEAAAIAKPCERAKDECRHLCFASCRPLYCRLPISIGLLNMLYLNSYKLLW